MTQKIGSCEQLKGLLYLLNQALSKSLKHSRNYNLTHKQGHAVQ
jgi:hypothetical protein